MRPTLSPVRALFVLALGVSVGALAACPFKVESGSAGSNIPSDVEPGDGPADFFVDPSDPSESLESVAEIEGSLVLVGIEVPLLANSELEVIRGDLIVEDNPDLSSLTFRNLHTIGGEVRIIRNPNLQNFTADGLIDVDGIFRLDDNPALSFTRLDNLSSTGGLRVHSPQMNALEFPSLVDVNGDVFIGALAFAANTSAGTMTFESLREVDGDFLILRNAQLRTLSADALQEVGGVFVLEENPRLTTISFPMLNAADNGVCVCRNGSLDGCTAAVLAEQIASDGPVVIEGNRTDCTD